MNRPRIMLTACSSGTGKTTLTCGILQALCNRTLHPAAFKCGPDYIDPMFHREIIGAKSGNLDLFLLKEETVRWLFYNNSEGAELSVLEGVMGYYDGIGMTEQASSYSLAKVLATPAVLIVDGRGSALSLIAQIKGMAEFRPNSCIKGVIFNRLSASLYPALKECLERELGIQALGFLPVIKSGTLQSRHLGLVTAEEVQDLKFRLNCLAEQVEKTVDLDGLIRLSKTAPALIERPPVLPEPIGTQIRIAVARDKAFCFYYEDSLDLLRYLGAELIPFSPLEDTALPENCNGVFLGGGYPELYAEQLEQNKKMRENIRTALLGGMPCVAECGGFLYLHRTLEDDTGKPYAMAGVLHADAHKTEHLQHFGYVSLTAKRDNLLCKAGEQIPVHEFHYWNSTNCGNDFIAEKASNQKTWNEIIAGKTLFAGFPHLHFYSNPDFAISFLKACVDFQRRSIS